MKKYFKTTLNDYLNENETNTLTVFHGTLPKFVDSIKKNGLEDKSPTPYQQGWYMVSTDIESALFHATNDDNNDFVYVFEFKIPIIENDRWLGYPYLWKGYIRNENSTWFALMRKIPSNFISKIHKISYDDYIDRKNKRF